MSRRKNNHYDLITLGAGSAAFAAAHVAQGLNKKVFMIEERQVGGSCLNYGCVPSKFLIEAAKVYHSALNPKFSGLHGNMKLNFAELLKEKDDIIHHYRKIKREGITDGITLKHGVASFEDCNSINLEGKTFTADRILIATGSEPVLPQIEGLAGIDFLTSDLLISDEKIELGELPESLLVIGGGYIALELGQMFARFGTKVTMIERGSHILSSGGYEAEVGPLIESILEKEGIEIIRSAKVLSLSKLDDSRVVARIQSGGKKTKRHFEKILIASGRRAMLGQLEISAAGIELTDEENVKVDEYLRTSVPHIFAAGDVIGHQHGFQLATPVAVRDGALSARNAFAKDEDLEKIDHRVIPRTIFTDPEIAMVGATEDDLKKQKRKYKSSSIPLSAVSRSVLCHHDQGLIKMLFDAKTQEVLGVTAVGYCAGEFIHEAAMAMHFHAKQTDFENLIHVYPSIAEGLRIVAKNFDYAA